MKRTTKGVRSRELNSLIWISGFIEAAGLYKGIYAELNPKGREIAIKLVESGFIPSRIETHRAMKILMDIRRAVNNTDRTGLFDLNLIQPSHD